MMAVLIVNLTKPRLTWKESINKGLSRLGLPIGNSMEDCLDVLFNWCGKTQPIVEGTIPWVWIKSGKMKLSTRPTQSLPVTTCFKFLPPFLAMMDYNLEL